MSLTAGLEGYCLVAVPPSYPPTGGCGHILGPFGKAMLASITSDYELFGTVSVTDAFSTTKVSELHLSSTTICTEPEPSQNTSSTISTPSSPELPRACHSTLQSPRWSITLEPSSTEKPRKSTSDIALDGDKSGCCRRRRRRHAQSVRRVKTLQGSPRITAAPIRRVRSEGCVSWQTCAASSCSRQEDGTALNVSAQGSRCSLVASTTCSCLPTACPVFSTIVVEAAPTGEAINVAFSGCTEDEAVPTTTGSNRIALLTLRRKALIDELSRLHLELLDSLRAEWLLTRVFPEGFEELQSYIVDPNPRLKSTSFPLVHLLQHSTLNGFSNRAQVDCHEPSGGREGETLGTFEPSDCQADLLMRETSSSSALTGSSSFKGSLQSFASATASQLGICSAAGNTEMMAQSMEYEPSVSTAELHTSRTSNWSESRLTALSQLEQRLARLEEDYAVVSQIYKVHRQRASETHWTAYRSAYKCNAQKLRELSKEMERLRREIKMAASSSQDPLQRSNSLSASQTSAAFTPDPDTGVVSATLPRRRQFRPPPCIRRHTMAQPRTGANSWWTLKRRMGSRPTLPTAPPSMFTSVCDGPAVLSTAAAAAAAEETAKSDRPSNYGSLGRQGRIQAQGRTRLSLLSLAFRIPLRTMPKHRSLTAQQSDQSSMDTLANENSSRPPSGTRVTPEPDEVMSDETPKPRLRGTRWTTCRKPTARPFSSLELLPFKDTEAQENCRLRRSRSYPDTQDWNNPTFFQSSRTESSVLVANKSPDPLDDIKHASPVTDLLRTDFPGETNLASENQTDPLKDGDQASSRPPQLISKSVLSAASSSLRSSSGCYSFSSQASSQLSSLALSTSCGQGSTARVRTETCTSTPPRSPPLEVPANDVVHLRRPARMPPAGASAAAAAATNTPIGDNQDANDASCQAFCPATNSIRCICSCISEVETADALRSCSCLDSAILVEGPALEDVHSCDTLTPVPQRRPSPLPDGLDEHSIDMPNFLKPAHRPEKGRSCTLPGNGSNDRGSKKLENGISVRRSFNPLAIFRIARGQSTEEEVAAAAAPATAPTPTPTLMPNTAPVASPVPVTKPRQSFWQRARQSLLPMAATNSRWQK